MLSKVQQEWLQHLSDIKPVKVVLYNPKSKDIFISQKAQLKTLLGGEFEIVHMGATALGISGKGDVDIYIPVEEAQFDSTMIKLQTVLGYPGSHYHLERVRWNLVVDNIEVEILLMNKKNETWVKMVAFETYLRTHPEALNSYQKLKEEAEGQSTREYYRRKLIFMNEVLEKVKA